MHYDENSGLQKRDNGINPVLKVHLALMQYTLAVKTYHKNPSERKAERTDVWKHDRHFSRTEWSGKDCQYDGLPMESGSEQGICAGQL